MSDSARYIDPLERIDLAVKAALKRKMDRRSGKVKKDLGDEEKASYAMRDHVAMLNLRDLIAVLAETGVTIRSSEFPAWRPTIRSTEEIKGITGCTIVATDGNLGLFIRADEPAFFGHIQHFDGKVKVLHGVPGPSKTKEPSTKRKSTVPSEKERQQNEAKTKRILVLLDDLE